MTERSPIGQQPEDGVGVESVPLLEEQRGNGQEGLKRRFYQAGRVIDAVETFPVDKPWEMEHLNELTLTSLISMGVSESLVGFDRLDYYAQKAVGGVFAEMGVAIDEWQDGRHEKESVVLREHKQRINELKEDWRVALKGKHYWAARKASFMRAEKGEGQYLETLLESWSEEMANVDIKTKEAENKLREEKMNQGVQEAFDFYTLIGCSSEDAEEARKDSDLVESRKRVHYWASAGVRGFVSLVDYHQAVVKDIADLGTASNLLTKQWDPKPPNTEMFGLLAASEMDLVVTETFRILLDMDIVDVDYKEEEMDAVGGNRVVVRVPKVKEKKYLKDYDLLKSAFSENHTPEQRREWLEKMKRCVKDRLKRAGVKNATLWSSQALPVALAFYEILLLGSRGAVRRDFEGNTVKVVETDSSDKVVLDVRGNPVYESEEHGPGTITGWFNDLEEKGFRTKDRVLGQGVGGFSAPTALAVFGTPDRYLKCTFEKFEIEIGGQEITMLEAVRTGKATVGECFAWMKENARAVEALNLFRAVGMIESIPATPIARLDVIHSERSADDKFIAETVKYFKSVNKALSMIFKDERWKIAAIQANIISVIVRYARRTDPTEGGNPQGVREEWDFGQWFDTTWNAVGRHLCTVSPEMDWSVFDLGCSLGKLKSVKERGGVRINDRVGMILFSDVERNPRLMSILDKDPLKNPKTAYTRVARYGPDGNAYDPDTQRKERDVVVAKLLDSIKD